MKADQTHIAFETLMDHESFVRAVLARMVSSEDQVGDLLQETWVRALQSPPATGKSVRAWLATVARNLARDSHRRRASREARETDHARSEADHSQQAGRARLELHQHVVQAILQLDEPYQTVVLLHYYEGLSHAQVASQLGRKESTVRSQLHRAHALLKGKLDQDYGDDRRSWMLIGVPWIAENEGLAALGLASRPVVGLGGMVLLAVGASVLGWITWALVGSQEPSKDTQVQGIAVAQVQSGERRAQGPASEQAQAASALSGEREPVQREADLGVSGNEVGTLVRVLSGGEPLAGVSVWNFNVAVRAVRGNATVQAAILMGVYSGGMGGLVEVSRKASVVAVTDSKGLARVAIDGPDAFLFVSGQGYFAYRPIVAFADSLDSEGTVEITVERDPHVVAHVVDRQGRPVAGVPVELSMVYHNAPGSGSITPTEKAVVERLRSSAEGGRVEFSEFHDLIPRQPGDGLKWLLRVAVPGAYSAPLLLKDVKHRKSEAPSTRLVIPRTGSLKVRLDAPGSLARSVNARVTLRGLRDSGKAFGPEGFAVLKNGEAVFPHVALKNRFEVGLESAGAGLSLRWQGDGPLQVGQEIEAVLKPEQGLRFEGRLLVEAGKVPTAMPYTLLLLNGEPREVGRATFLPGADGRFQVGLPGVQVDSGPLHAEILNYFDLEGDNRRFRTRLGLVAPLAGLVTPLGDVLLRRVPFQMKGHCVDEQGQPIEGVRLSADLDIKMHGTVTSSKNDGSFAIGGRWPREPKLKLSWNTDWYLAAPVDFSKGIEDLRVVLRPCGSIEGFVQGLDSELSSAMSVRAILDGQVPGTNGYVPLGGVLDPASGHFEIGRVKQGTYRLQVVHASVPLVTLRGIRVVPGQASSDARLQGIELERTPDEFKVYVSGPDGKAMRWASITVYQDGKTAAQFDVSDGVGVCTLVVGSKTELVISASGFRPKRVGPLQVSAFEGLRVTLDRGIQVFLTATKHPVLQEGEDSVRLSLRHVRQDRGATPQTPGPLQDWIVSLPASIAQPGQVSVSFPGPGRYVLYSSLRHSMDGGMMMASVATPVSNGDKVFEVTIQESDQGKLLELPLPESVFGSR